MAKLFCAVVGVGSIFPVDIHLNETVGDLKDKIKQKKPSCSHFDADLLKLYLAREGDTWLNSRDEDITALETNGFPDRIKRLMQEHLVLDEASRLDDDDYFRKEFKRVEGDIHVLVELPSSKDVVVRDITAATTPLTVEQIEMAMNKVLEERDQKRSVYSISNCPSSKELIFRQRLGLEYSTVSVNEVIDNTIPGYKWSDLTEKHPKQREAYIKYVEQHLRDALMVEGRQKDFLKDVAGEQDLLDCDDPDRLPFKVKGTADLMIIDEAAKRINDVFAGLRFVIEVKKDSPRYSER